MNIHRSDRFVPRVKAIVPAMRRLYVHDRLHRVRVQPVTHRHRLDGARVSSDVLETRYLIPRLRIGGYACGIVDNKQSRRRGGRTSRGFTAWEEADEASRFLWRGSASNRPLSRPM